MVRVFPEITQRSELADPTDFVPPTEAERVANDFLWGYENKTTRNNYRLSLRSWFEWCANLGMDPLRGYDREGMRRADIEKWVRYGQEVEGKAPRTIYHRMTALTGYYRRAIMDGHIDRNPMEFIKRPRIERRSSTNYLERGELARVIGEAKKRNARDHAIFCLLGLNGLRVSELIGIDIEHLGEDKGYDTVTVFRKGGKHQTLAMSPETAKAVESAIGGRTHGPLFTSRRTAGKRLSRNDIGRLVKDYAERCEIHKRLSPHSFRHSYITLSLNAGVSQRMVQAGAGRADPRMTAYYDHGSENRAAEATHTLTAFIAEMT